MQSYGSAPQRIGKVAPGIIGRRMDAVKPKANAPHLKVVKK